MIGYYRVRLRGYSVGDNVSAGIIKVENGKVEMASKRDRALGVSLNFEELSEETIRKLGLLEQKITA